MHAEFEHLTSVIRVWHDDQRHGDPYWGIVVRWINTENVELMLQQKKLTAGIYRAVMSAAEKFGIKRLLVRTYPDGADGPEVSQWLDVHTKEDIEKMAPEKPEIPAEVLAQLANRKIAVIEAKVSLKADFDGDGPELPAFEWNTDVTYRDAPITALLMLQQNIAAMVSKVVEDGKQLNLDAAAARV